MSNEKNEERWMENRMQRMRERRERSLPAFAQVWRSAEARRSVSRQHIPAHWRRLAFASATVVFAAAIAGYWSLTKGQQSRRVERDFARVEGALLTYWQAPTDVLFDTVSWNEPAEP